jgi:hypothetical protein
MAPFAKDIEQFLTARKAASDEARQNAAFFLTSGLDLQDALRSGPEEKRKILLRLERMIERERLKGSRRHWSYDLNRHIALKQAADRLGGDENRDNKPYMTAAGKAETKPSESIYGRKLKPKAAPKRRLRTAKA